MQNGDDNRSSKGCRVALVGFGGRLRALAQVLSEATDAVEFTGVYDPEPGRVREAVGKFCPQGRVYDSVEAVAGDPDVDWIMIGSPNYCHAPEAVVALQGGKHVFCEKPLATTIEDVAALQSAWRESGRTFILGLTLRHSPLYRTMQKWIAEGRIGDLVSMEFNEMLDFNHGGHIHSHPWRRKTALGGSHLLEKCCHDIDLAFWLADSLPARVASFGGKDVFVPEHAWMPRKIGTAADGRKPFVCWPTVGERVDPFNGDSDVVDNQVGIIEFDSGVRMTFHTNCMSGIPERRFYLVGTEGAIRGDALRGELECCRVGFDTECERVDDFGGDGHAGGDAVLARDLAATMVDGVVPHASLHEGVVSAVTCFAMNDAMRTNAVVECAPYWEQVGLR